MRNVITQRQFYASRSFKLLSLSLSLFVHTSLSVIEQRFIAHDDSVRRRRQRFQRSEIGRNNVTPMSRHAAHAALVGQQSLGLCVEERCVETPRGDVGGSNRRAIVAPVLEATESHVMPKQRDENVASVAKQIDIVRANVLQIVLKYS